MRLRTCYRYCRVIVGNCWHGANVNAKVANDRTALWLACEKEKDVVAKVLCNAETFNINLQNDGERTLLTLVLEKTHDGYKQNMLRARIVALLLRARAPLDVACDGSSGKTVRQLMNERLYGTEMEYLRDVGVIS